MSSLVKFLYYISALLVFLLLFFSYYYFPEYVSIGYSENIGMKMYKNKATLFYISSGLFLLFNIIIMISKIYVPVLPFRLFAFPHKKFWLQDEDSKEHLITVFTTWLNSFATVFNTFLFYILVSLLIINLSENQNFNFYVPIIYAGITVIALWWLVLIARLSYLKHQL